MSTGADLENAIYAAAKHYQAVDRCELQKQRTPRLHSGVYASKASVDFKGWYGRDRRPLYLEAKATSDGLLSFVVDGDGIKPDQLDAMRAAQARGIHMLLVVDFVREAEVYVVDTRRVCEFAAQAWRKSLDLKWCRSHGEIAKCQPAPHRRVWFLDTREHPLADVSLYACLAERAEAKDRCIDLFPVEIGPSKKLTARWADRPAPNTPEHAEYLRGLVAEGTGNAMRRGARPAPKWNPRRKGYGK